MSKASPINPEWTIVQIIEHLKQLAYESWRGRTGEERATELEQFLNETLDNYSEVLGFDRLEILKSIEARRDYSVMNYYQRANFPLLENVTIFESLEAFKNRCPSHEFICPNCGGISKDPETCDSGKVIKGKECDWKAYGLFGTLGKGCQLVIKDTFLQNGAVYKIFMPKELVNV